jgi:hypothetical protein
MRLHIINDVTFNLNNELLKLLKLNLLYEWRYNLQIYIHIRHVYLENRIYTKNDGCIPNRSHLAPINKTVVHEYAARKHSRLDTEVHQTPSLNSKTSKCVWNYRRRLLWYFNLQIYLCSSIITCYHRFIISKRSRNDSACSLACRNHHQSITYH